MSEAAKPVGRPMKFPYTFSAKIAQFPYKFYFQKQWMWKFYIFGVAASIPVFYKISQLGKFFVSFYSLEIHAKHHVIVSRNIFIQKEGQCCQQNPVKWIC